MTAEFLCGQEAVGMRGGRAATKQEVGAPPMAAVVGVSGSLALVPLLRFGAPRDLRTGGGKYKRYIRTLLVICSSKYL